MRLAWLFYMIVLTVFTLSATHRTVEATVGPGIDCKKASGVIEKLICSDQELAALDQKMATTFKAALAVANQDANPEEATQSLKAYQRDWIKGRNECVKETDSRQCTQQSYERRIAELQVRWGLIPGNKKVTYSCNQNPDDELVATFFQAQIPAVRLERGDRMAIGLLGPSGSGSRYSGAFGITFWIKGDEAQVEWLQGKSFKCKARP